MSIERLSDAADVEAAIRRGRVSFMGLDMLVAPGALVPRAETELLARAALDALANVASPRVIDMCCGAGNLACAIAQRVPGARVWASDLTDACVELARRNAAHVGVADRVAVCQGDLFGSFDGAGLEGTMDLVVCNPPYISDQRLASERASLLRHEPQEAFAAGPYGLSIHQRVVRDALRYLRPGGLLGVEIGVGQQRQVELLFRRTRGYASIEVSCDDAGEPRVIVGRRSADSETQGESG